MDSVGGFFTGTGEKRHAEGEEYLDNFERHCSLLER